MLDIKSLQAKLQKITQDYNFAKSALSSVGNLFAPGGIVGTAIKPVIKSPEIIKAKIAAKKK